MIQTPRLWRTSKEQLKSRNRRRRRRRRRKRKEREEVKDTSLKVKKETITQSAMQEETRAKVERKGEEEEKRAREKVMGMHAFRLNLQRPNHETRTRCITYSISSTAKNDPVSIIKAPAHFLGSSKRRNPGLLYVKHMVHHSTVNKSCFILLPSAEQQHAPLPPHPHGKPCHEKVMAIKDMQIKSKLQ